MLPTQATGFMLSLLTVADDLHHDIQGVLDQGQGEQLDRIRNNLWESSLQNRQIVNHLMKLLSPPVRDSLFTRRELAKENPLIEVVEEKEDSESMSKVTR